MTRNSLTVNFNTDGSDVIKIGTKVQVLKTIEDKQFYHQAEVMSIRNSNDPDGAGAVEYYVHFTDFNKRLDEWVSVDKMDLSTIELPSLTEKTPAKSAHGNHGSVGRKREREKEVSKKGGRTVSVVTTNSASGYLSVETPTLTRHGSVISSNSDLTALESNEGSNVNNNGNGANSKVNELEKLRRGGSMTQRQEEISRVKNIDRIEMGQHVIRTWYFSPYPQELCTNTNGSCGGGGDSIIYICEFCLFYFGNRSDLKRHREKCTLFHPPGMEIYRNGDYSFWELDGHKQKTFCRNLCLLSKLFLDHKTLFYDVDPFLFYVLTENDARGCHMIGYFSKEKESAENYNVACILTLPQHQRKGYGRLLIEFSYELTKRENKTGSPEKPLSDLGLLSYRSFWTDTIVSTLLELISDDRPSVSIDQLSKMTGFTCDDILHTLQAMDALRYRKGQHIIVLSEKHLADHEKMNGKVKVRVDPKHLHWTPPIFTFSQLRFI